MVGKRARERVGIDCSADGMTQQHFAEMTDLNVIMKKWLKGGPDPRAIPDFSRYRDVSHGWDYQDIVNMTLSVGDDFMELPAEMRSRFKNDPALLLAFVSDPANTEEAVRLGLVEAPAHFPLDVNVRTDSQLVNTSVNTEVGHEKAS